MEWKTRTPLCEIFYKYRSDKCPEIYHTYSLEYYKLLKDYINKFESILEIGVGDYEMMKKISGEDYKCGASLRGWKEFFPKAKIFGFDIETKYFFNEDRIFLYYTDQSEEYELEKTMNELSKNHNPSFDLIIDDGSHIVEDMILTYKTLFRYVKIGGMYIIEDIKKKDMNRFLNMDLIGGHIKMYYDGQFDWDGFIVIEKTK